jgi:anti-sigma B factor antagonist
MPLSVKRSVKSPGILMLSVGGSLDANTSSQLEVEVDDVLEGSARGLIFDFELLEFISSAGLRIVMMAQKGLKKKGSSVMILNMQPQIRKVFEIIKALPSETVFSSVKELDDYLADMQVKFREETEE